METKEEDLSTIVLEILRSVNNKILGENITIILLNDEIDNRHTLYIYDDDNKIAFHFDDKYKAKYVEKSLRGMFDTVKRIKKGLEIAVEAESKNKKEIVEDPMIADGIYEDLDFDIVDYKILKFKKTPVSDFIKKHTKNKSVLKTRSTMYDVYKEMLLDDYKNADMVVPDENSLEFKKVIITESIESERRSLSLLEINSKSGEECTDKYIQDTCKIYGFTEEEMMESLKNGSLEKTISTRIIQKAIKTDISKQEKRKAVLDVLLVRKDKVEEFIESNPEYDVTQIDPKGILSILAKKSFIIKIMDIVSEEYKKKPSSPEMIEKNFREKMVNESKKNNLVYIGNGEYRKFYLMKDQIDRCLGVLNQIDKKIDEKKKSVSP